MCGSMINIAKEPDMFCNPSKLNVVIMTHSDLRPWAVAVLWMIPS